MDRIIGVILALSLFFVGTLALDCMCDRKNCPFLDPSACPLGITKDACFCCSVCFKTEGEECGGPFDIDGKCGGDLICFKPPPPSGEDDGYQFNAKGKCLPRSESDS
uniref:U48-Liphistoxin-Lsp1a_1 n=1 Tax=Liphistius sp. SGP-2016 TaxID=1905180 RepID=A0A4Q8K1M6_9ARAC